MNWISVKDKLPEPTDWVVGRIKWDGYVAYTDVVTLYSFYNAREYWADHHGKRVPVTHWMPLPEPPEDA